MWAWFSCRGVAQVSNTFLLDILNSIYIHAFTSRLLLLERTKSCDARVCSLRKYQQFCQPLRHNLISFWVQFFVGPDTPRRIYMQEEGGGICFFFDRKTNCQLLKIVHLAVSRGNNPASLFWRLTDITDVKVFKIENYFRWNWIS